MKNTKIEWAEQTFNPVWGCRLGCEYCYARGIAKRFYRNIARREVKFYERVNWDNWLEKPEEERVKIQAELEQRLKNFEPTVLYSQFDRFVEGKGVIFVGSMSDPADWEQAVFDEVLIHLFNSGFENRAYVILTKRPKLTLQKLEAHYEKYAIQRNNYIYGAFIRELIFGVTVENQADYEKRVPILRKFPTRWLLSIEPIFGRVQIENLFDWVIVGVQTGRKFKRNYKDFADYGREINSYIEELNETVKCPLFVKKIYEWNGEYYTPTNEHNFRTEQPRMIVL